jgi:putative membrane protein
VTIVGQYAFSALGLILIVASTNHANAMAMIGTIGVALLLSSALPVVTVVLVRRGGLFDAIERRAARLLGNAHPLLQGIEGQRLDADIDALMSRAGLLLRAFLWQFSGCALGAPETYWTLGMLGQPVSPGDAIAIEALT